MDQVPLTSQLTAREYGSVHALCLRAAGPGVKTAPRFSACLAAPSGNLLVFLLNFRFEILLKLPLNYRIFSEKRVFIVVDY